MLSKSGAVKLTANFEANLASVEVFCRDADIRHSYDRLLVAILETLIPNLERFPKIGRSFLARETRSAESHALSAKLKIRIGAGEIREYLLDDYLILYAVIDEAVYLLSIRHHRQLSFNLDRFWPK